MSKKALILGITGQDGAFLTQFLLDRNYEVFGTSRETAGGNSHNLKALGIDKKVRVFTADIKESNSIKKVILDLKPDEIYNLSGLTSVALSYEKPIEAFESIALGSINLVEILKTSGLPARLYNAGSSEIFGHLPHVPANESSKLNPTSPYGIAKAASFQTVSSYRQAFGLYACTGLLFNHESFLRPKKFVTQKIISGAKNIAAGKAEKLELGNLDISRDWGWAPEYVEAMWKMLQQTHPEDYVIATGETNSLKDFVAAAFQYYNLSWKDHVVVNESLKRPTDILWNGGNPQKAKDKLNWSAKNKMHDVVKLMATALQE